MMSLRRRLFTLLLVACVALAGCLFALIRLLHVGAATREATATETAERAMIALARHLDDGLAPAGPNVDGVLRDLAHTLESGTVGICSTTGEILVEHTTRKPNRRGPPDHGPPPDFDEGPHDGPPPGMAADRLWPLDRERVHDACSQAGRQPRTTRALVPDDVLTIATLQTKGDVVAFSVARYPRAEEEHAPPYAVALLAFVGGITTLLLALTAHGAWVLRASTNSLQASVQALKRDLRAPISQPRALELAEVAEQLRTFASTLADVQEREEAQQRLAGLGRVVAGVAHEVRNPLAGIKLRLDAMALRSLDERSRVDVEKCLREVGRLDRLVRALLLASRKRTVERVAFEAGPWLAERAEQMNDPRIECEGAATIFGEREGLSGALDNLLRNALEASPTGIVRAVVRDEEKRTIVEVIDDGPGVPPERERELFEPFFTTKGAGTGLGLVLARAGVEAHGGTLEYARKNDQTHFTMSIPHE